MPFDYLKVVQGFVEFIGLFLIGQFLVYVLSFGRHEQNPIYRFFRFLTSPVVKVARFITPRAIVDRHIPLVAFLLTFWSWVLLVILRLGGAKAGTA